MSEANLKSEDNLEQPTEEPSGCKKLLQPKFLIPIIAGAVVVIVVVVVLCVVLIKDDDSSSSIIDNNDNSSSEVPDIPEIEPLGWEESFKKAEEFLKDFSLDDKVMLLYSTENLQGKCVGSIDANKARNFPGICLQDGPAGVRLAKNTQHWQAAINTASTFNRDLMYRVGAAQGKEFKIKKIDIMLAPCMNILRNPLGGRVWEAYGEDPFLSGEAAVQIIQGIQRQGVMACAKHYIANEIDDPRHNNTANIPEQALWEIYIEPFYKSVKKGDVASFMESYNAVNGEFMTRNKELLQNILKDKIGFQGFVMSDWWSINTDSYENFANGMDMNMPGGPNCCDKTGKDGSWWAKIPEWINEGKISQDRVDDAAKRIIAAMYKVNLLNDSKTLTDDDLYPNYVNLDKKSRSDKTKALNREVGQESIVLLKNDNNFLPLNNNKIATPSFSSLKIFGNSADESECLKDNDCTCKGDSTSYETGEATRYFTGYVGLGWGSGTTHFEYQETPLKAIKAKAESLGKTVTSSTGLNGNYITGFKEIPPVAASECSDVNIVFIAADSGEEYIVVESNVGDRNSLDAWHNGNELVDGVLSYCDNIVLVILGPATVTIKEEWKTSDKIKAILFGGMLGAEGGNAIADVLFGEVVPSGHLTFVWAPVGSYPNVTKTTTLTGKEYIAYDYNYEEGLFVGQRYVDKHNKPFDYPFGFGLSYTSFEFSDLALTMGDNGLTVKFKVKNAGKYDGKVVPMVFLKFPIDDYPEKVLKGFDKKEIKSGETETFEILIEDHDLSYYDVSKKDFTRPSTNKYTVYVGENARDNKLTGTVGGDTDYANVDERWVEYYRKADNFLKDFTLEEKMLLTYSTENMVGKCVGSIDANKARNFPGLCLQDGPAGVRKAKKTQHWQAAINTATTFNRELMYKVGKAQGKEFKDKGIDIMLSPCMNILRNPLGGRVWEAYGEDPFLSGEAAAQVIKGIEENGVMACAKHYIANEIEDPRHNSTSNIPEQALWEIYIEPFYKSVKKGNVASVMESYNAVNNEFMTRNKRLLQEILKDKIGFAGFIMSDWWSINTDSYENFGNGCDMNMPGGPKCCEKTGKNGSWWAKIPEWIQNGYITQDRVDDAARRIIAAMYKVNLLDDSKTLTDANYYPEYVNLDAETISDDTKALNREVGQESIVLLKNEDNILPLTNLDLYSSYKLFGNSAAESECLKDNDCTCKGDSSTYEAGEASRYFSGYVGLGWGSGTTHFEYQVTPLAAISERLTGKTFTSSTDLEGDYTNYKEKLPTAASDCADLNIVFIAANSGEEYIVVESNVGDRNSLDAWHGGNDLVDKVSSLCSDKKIILVILGPATVNIKSEWKATTSNIKAILFGGMLGAEGGNAIADVLFGDVNPSGHLTFVWAPVGSYPNVTKTPSTSGVDYIQYDYNYVEGLFVGQRYVDKNNLPYDYPFGFGLSYTTFEFSDLRFEIKENKLNVKFKVKNTGSKNGKVVPMVFLKIPIENYPEKVLRGFDKKEITSGNTETFEILIDEHDLSYYDVNVQDFVIAKGYYTVYVGENARDIKLKSMVNVKWVEYYRKADNFLKDFTLEEKMLLTYSTENMNGKCVGSIDANKARNFPGLCLQDGPAGVRFATNVQSWQAAINTASTFNRELMYKVGAAQAREFKGKGIDIMLSPCMNILRNPLGGRIWEAYGEDPFLSGEAAVQAIKGMQEQGVMACAKHYIANEIEDPRHTSSSNIPEQALWEIYIEPFYKSVKKGDVASVMESYNAVNGEFMTRNKRLLQEILKDKIGFAGFIMSDWWAINTETYENFAFGCDMNMPGGPGWTAEPTGKDGSWWSKIPEWIDDTTNDMTQDRVNDAARRIIAAMYRVNLLSDRTLTDADLYPNYVDLNRISVVASKDGVLSENKGLNREVGQESIVLLENKDNFLPLANNKNANPTFSSLKIFGNSAEESVCLNKTENSSDCVCIGTTVNPDDNRYFKGYVGLGWGSGTTSFQYQVAPVDAIKAKAESLGKTVTSSTGLTGEWNNLKEVIPTAATECSDLNIVFIAANSGEEYLITEGLKGDRTTLDAWHGGNDLVDAVLNLCNNVVLVILGPATVNIKSEWRSNSKLKAILFGGMLGAEGGNAITDVLFGEVVPSGHLTFVWAPVGSYPSVTPATKKDGEDAQITVDYNYDEGLFVGQRYVEKYSKPFDYPFGYGLSYTTFEISDPTLTMKENGLTVKFDVKNTGKYDGKVVPMVFLGIPVPDPDNYPAKVFKGFDKKLIKSGESASFEIFIDDHDLSYYDTTAEDFVRPTTGTYTVYVGENAKSENLKSKTVSASY